MTDHDDETIKRLEEIASTTEESVVRLSAADKAVLTRMISAWRGWGFAFGSFRQILIFVGILGTAIIGIRVGWSALIDLMLSRGGSGP